MSVNLELPTADGLARLAPGKTRDKILRPMRQIQTGIARQLEQEGLVYPVKGKGNFIADSTSIKRISKKAYTQEMRELIYKGQTLGYDEEELTELVRVCYKEGIK